MLLNLGGCTVFEVNLADTGGHGSLRVTCMADPVRYGPIQVISQGIAALLGPEPGLEGAKDLDLSLSTGIRIAVSGQSAGCPLIGPAAGLSQV